MCIKLINVSLNIVIIIEQRHIFTDRKNNCKKPHFDICIILILPLANHKKTRHLYVKSPRLVMYFLN